MTTADTTAIAAKFKRNRYQRLGIAVRLNSRKRPTIKKILEIRAKTEPGFRACEAIAGGVEVGAALGCERRTAAENERATADIGNRSQRA